MYGCDTASNHSFILSLLSYFLFYALRIFPWTLNSIGFNISVEVIFASGVSCSLLWYASEQGYVIGPDVSMYMCVYVMCVYLI